MGQVGVRASAKQDPTRGTPAIGRRPADENPKLDSRAAQFSVQRFGKLPPRYRTVPRSAQSSIEGGTTGPNDQHRGEMAVELGESPTGAPNCATPSG